MCRLVAVVVFLSSALAVGQVGKAELVEGKAQRKARDGQTTPLSAGTEIHLGDVLEVASGNVKLSLSDGSVLMLSEGARLAVSEADFAALDRRRVSLKLLFGSLWAKVVRASSSGAKFDVVTPRAVAGVRGTVLQVDLFADGKKLKGQCVCVYEGSVEVTPQGKAARSHAVEANHHARTEKTTRVKDGVGHGTPFEAFVKANQ